MSGLNYLQLKIPVDNANLVFEAIVSKYGNALDLTDAEGVPLEPPTLEEQAKLALINVCKAAVEEKARADAAAAVTVPELNIS